MNNSSTYTAAANILSGMDGEAFEVDISNPVCPCCGVNLVLMDTTIGDENEELNIDSINEAYINGSKLIPLINDIAVSIVNNYLTYEDDADGADLIYIEKKELISVIHRKAIELNSVLKNSYGIDVSVHELELSIRKEIKVVLKNY